MELATAVLAHPCVCQMRTMSMPRSRPVAIAATSRSSIHVLATLHTLEMFISCNKTTVGLSMFDNVTHHTMPRNAMPCHAMPCHATPHHTTPCQPVITVDTQQTKTTHEFSWVESHHSRQLTHHDTHCPATDRWQHQQERVNYVQTTTTTYCGTVCPTDVNLKHSWTNSSSENNTNCLNYSVSPTAAVFCSEQLEKVVSYCWNVTRNSLYLF